MGDNQTEPERPRSLLEGALHYIGILLRYKWLIVIISLVGAAGSVGFAYLTLTLPVERNPMPNFYRASATVVVQSDDVSAVSMSSLLSSIGVRNEGSGMNYASLVQRVLSSRPFLDAIVDEFDIVERHNVVQDIRTSARGLVRGKIGRSFDGTSGILIISFQDTDPVFAAEVTNRMVSLLGEWFADWGGNSQQRSIIELEERVNEVETEILELESQIVAKQLELGVLRVEQIADIQTQMIADLQSQLVGIEMEIRNYEENAKIEDFTLSLLRTRRENLIRTIRDVEQGYAGAEKTMPARDELPRLSLELNRLEAALEVQMKIFGSLSQQYEITQLAAKAEPLISVLEPAEVPERKAGPYRGQLVMQLTIAAFVGSIIIVIIIHMLRTIMNDPEKMKLLRREKK